MLPNLHVPAEVMSEVFQYCSPSDLAAASRVSQSWRRTTFFQLHREISIETLPHLEALISRLELEEADHDLQIGPCLRTLIVNPDLDHSINHTDNTDVVVKCPWLRLKDDELLCNRFFSVIPKLIRLEELVWLVDSNTYRAPDLFIRFRDACPKLELLNVATSEWLQHSSGVFLFIRQVLASENWTDLAIDLSLGGGDTPAALNQMSAMIEQLPGLVNLTLKLPGKPFVVDFLCQLKNPLSKLQSLSLEGEWPERERDINSMSEDSLGSFFRRHPNLTKVSLRWNPRLIPEVVPPADPALMSSLFPSITSFSGPINHCMGLVASNIAEQLVELEVDRMIDTFELDGETNPIPTLVKMARPLPNLKRLDFDRHYTRTRAHGGPYYVDETILNNMLAVTPALTQLCTGFFTGKWETFLQPLRHVPHLTQLTTVVAHRFPEGSAYSEAAHAEFMQMVEKKFQVLCPDIKLDLHLVEEHHTP